MKKGIWYALGAYVTWGLFPVYWKLLSGIPALQLLGHRIFWSFLLLFGILLVARQGRAFQATLNRRVLLIYRENGGHSTDYADTTAALEYVIQHGLVP